MRPLLAAAAGLAAPPGFVFLREAVAARQCIAGGGSYDHIRSICDMTAIHEFVPFASRHTGLLWYTLALALVFIGGEIINHLPSIQLRGRRALEGFTRRRTSLAAEGPQDSATR